MTAATADEIFDRRIESTLDQLARVDELISQLSETSYPEAFLIRQHEAHRADLIRELCHTAHRFQYPDGAVHAHYPECATHDG